MDLINNNRIYFAIYCITQMWWGSDEDCYIDLTDVTLPNQKSLKSSSIAPCVVSFLMHNTTFLLKMIMYVNRIFNIIKMIYLLLSMLYLISSETHCEHTFNKDADCKISKEGCLACINCKCIIIQKHQQNLMYEKTATGRSSMYFPISKVQYSFTA